MSDYSNMKQRVTSEMTSRAGTRLVKETVVVAKAVPYIKATKSERKGALEALDAIKKLFGPKGKHWVQGQYHTLRQGVDAFCLSGGMNKIDGHYEAIARLAISAAIVELYPRSLDLDEADVSERVVKDALASEGTITGFNDDNKTKWADVLKVLRRAREILST